MIVFDAVTKRYATAQGQILAIDEVTLSVERGQFVALCGSSGSGKSTLLMLAGAMTTADAGRVVVAGRELAALSASQRARLRAEKIGFVFQMFHLLPYLSVLDNVLAAARPGCHAQNRDRAIALLERFGLTDRQTHRPGELSAGERQRTAMARALLNDPAILLADEPTGNLDADNAGIVLNLLCDFHAAGGTVLLATHDAAAAARAERTVHLHRGKCASDAHAPLEPRCP